jgi:hypothetical protein
VVADASYLPEITVASRRSRWPGDAVIDTMLKRDAKVNRY